MNTQPNSWPMHDCRAENPDDGGHLVSWSTPAAAVGRISPYSAGIRACCLTSRRWCAQLVVSEPADVPLSGSVGAAHGLNSAQAWNFETSPERTRP